MSKTVEMPVDLLEEMIDLCFPASTDSRMQHLMDRNNDGALAPQEREELESLVDLSERMSLLRAKALIVLGRPVK